VIIGTILIVVAVIAIGVFLDRKIGILPRPKELKGNVMVEVNRTKTVESKRPRYEAGEAPSTAIRARGAQLDKLRASRRCSKCREPLASTGDDENVRYGDGELLVVHLRCGKCGETRSLYVDASA
jgi:RNase P subunit RPR2